MAKEEREAESRSISRWDPFGELDIWERRSPLREFASASSRLARLMDEMFGARTLRSARLLPALDIAEDDQCYTVTVELPGASRGDINIECQDNVLTIRGEKRSEREEKKEQRCWVERTYGSFSRSFTLPPNVDQEKLEANFKDGVLTIVVPKTEESKPKVIHIRP